MPKIAHQASKEMIKSLETHLVKRAENFTDEFNAIFLIGLMSIVDDHYAENTEKGTQLKDKLAGASFLLSPRKERLDEIEKQIGKDLAPPIREELDNLKFLSESLYQLKNLQISLLNKKEHESNPAYYKKEQKIISDMLVCVNKLVKPIREELDQEHKENSKKLRRSIGIAALKIAVILVALTIVSWPLLPTVVLPVLIALAMTTPAKIFAATLSVIGAGLGLGVGIKKSFFTEKTFKLSQVIQISPGLSKLCQIAFEISRMGNKISEDLKEEIKNQRSIKTKPAPAKAKSTSTKPEPALVEPKPTSVETKSTLAKGPG